MLYLGRCCVLKVIYELDKRKVNCKLISGLLRMKGKDLSPDRIQKAQRMMETQTQCGSQLKW